MIRYRRKQIVRTKAPIGSGSPLQQTLLKLPLLKDWTTPLNVTPLVKTFMYKGKQYRSSNREVQEALDQLVNLGVLDKKNA